jgi:hypothetical protein
LVIDTPRDPLPLFGEIADSLGRILRAPRRRLLRGGEKAGLENIPA